MKYLKISTMTLHPSQGSWQFVLFSTTLTVACLDMFRRKDWRVDAMLHVYRLRGLVCDKEMPSYLRSV